MSRKNNVLFIFLSWILLINSAFSATQAPNEKIPLTIHFDWQYQQANDAEHAFKDVHINKTILLNSDDHDYKIAISQSKITAGKLPVTLALLIKPLIVDSEKADLQFEIIEYGFSQSGAIWAQPRMLLKNGEEAEMVSSHLANPHFSLKISAKW